MDKNNKYIGTIIQGKKVIFKVDDNIYIKKIKEKNKVRRKEYIVSESVNIICNDLNDDYVFIDSDNRPYFNRLLLVLIIGGIFISILSFLIMGGLSIDESNNLFILPMTGCIVISCILFLILMVYLFYVIFKQPKNIYQNFTETIEGEIIDYRRSEYRHDKDDIYHCDYNIMYKYKIPNGNIIHSVVDRYSAKLLYKDYPLNKTVMIRYNPNKCCESCLLDEYDALFNNKKFVDSSVTIRWIGKITNIKTKCIDDDVDDYLKKYNLIDYIECEYMVSDVLYKTYSIFGVPHQRFKIGEEIMIFYDPDDNAKFFCDINKIYSKLDKHDY